VAGLALEFRRLGVVARDAPGAQGWVSHFMAPAPLLLDDRIRVFLGGWNADGISQIFFVDVERGDPTVVIRSSSKPVMGIGRPGCFDENGVFPGSMWADPTDGEGPILYYTGFQLGQRVRHFNFGGAARLDSACERAERVSEAPILDRSDEGLMVRAGISSVRYAGRVRSAYSAGNEWRNVGGTLRPVYDIYEQETPDGLSFSAEGACILRHDPKREHALGRPHYVCAGDETLLFFTTRDLTMRYRFGAAYERDGGWNRCRIHGLDATTHGFDDGMTYFPAPLTADGRLLIFYSGNGYGQAGLGVGEMVVT
jgi:hypothetical protein